MHFDDDEQELEATAEFVTARSKKRTKKKDEAARDEMCDSD